MVVRASTRSRGRPFAAGEDMTRPRQSRAGRRKSWTVIRCLLVVAAVFWMGRELWKLARPRIVARALTPDGGELCVIQRWNGPWDDPFFTTTFAYRPPATSPPGTNWLVYYHQHEDSFWGRADVQFDANRSQATIRRRGRRVIVFDWRTRTYTLFRRDEPMERDPWVMPDGWTPAGR